MRYGGGPLLVPGDRLRHLNVGPADRTFSIYIPYKHHNRPGRLLDSGLDRNFPVVSSGLKLLASRLLFVPGSPAALSETSSGQSRYRGTPSRSCSLTFLWSVR